MDWWPNEPRVSPWAGMNDACGVGGGPGEEPVAALRGVPACGSGGVAGDQAAGDSAEDVLEEYPALKREDVQACLDYASKLMA